MLEFNPFKSKKEKLVDIITSMSIQILQYEFLGPINLSEWGPPMEKIIYVILSRDKDSFRVVYVGDCEKTDEKAFFLNNPSFKCWIKQAGTEKSLYLAILPLFKTTKEQRSHILKKIIAQYKPACNDIISEPPPHKKSKQLESTCPCCGAKMKVDQILKNTTILRCSECGISDTRVNS